MTMKPPYGRRPPAANGPMGTPPAPHLRGSFTDRVMSRVAQEPTPSPGRVFLRSLAHLALRDALAALMTAWRLAFETSAPVPSSARASAAALFFSVVVVLGLGGSLVAGGSLALLGPDGPASWQQGPAAQPSASPLMLEAPTATPTPMPTPAPSPSPSPTVGPRPLPEVVISDQQPREPERADDSGKTEREDRARRETPEPDEREREDRKEKDD